MVLSRTAGLFENNLAQIDFGWIVLYQTCLNYFDMSKTWQLSKWVFSFMYIKII